VTAVPGGGVSSRERRPARMAWCGPKVTRMGDNGVVPRLGLTLPLVGRVPQLRRLQAALDDAEQGRGRGALLAGDAGVGKTRLLRELTSEAASRGCLVLTGQCLDVDEGGLPYLPFTEALGALAASDDADVVDAVAAWPALSTLVPQLWVAPSGRHHPGRSAASEQDIRRVRTEHDLGQLRLFDAVLGVLDALARTRPVVLALEDLHWADGATRDLLSFLMGRLGGRRLLVLATYRAEEVHRRHPLRPLLAELVRSAAVERVDVPPLSDDEARAFLTALAESPLPPDTLEQLVRRCEGNPFFAEELVAAGASGDNVPDGLADVLLTRLDQLSAQTRGVLRAVAVAGVKVADKAVAEVAGVGVLDVEEALREAVHHHVLVVDRGGYRFRHALLREAVYHDLLPGERSRMHAAYAARIAAMPPSRGSNARLAYHSLRCRDLPTALTALLKAADEAEELGAPGSALRHVEEALEIWDAVPADRRPSDRDETTLLLSASELAARSGEPERAIAYAREAARRVDDCPVLRRAAIWRRLAEALMTLEGTYDEAVDAIDRAWSLVADGEATTEQAWVLATRAQVLRGVGRFDDAEDSARAAAEAAKAAGAAAPHAAALTIQGVLADVRGDLDTARELLLQAEREAQAADALDVELRAGYYRALSYDDQAELSEALRLYRHTAQRAAESGLTWSPLGLSARTRLLGLRYTMGDWPDESEQDRPEAGVSDLVTAILQSTWLHILVARGRFEDADRMLALLHPEDGDRRGVDLWVVAAAAAGGAELASWRGEYRKAVTAVTDGMERARRILPRGLLNVRLGALGIEACGDWAADARRTRDTAGEREAVETGRTLWEQVERTVAEGMPRSGTIGPEGTAWLARARAATDGLDGAADAALWEEAVAAFGFGAVYEQALCRRRLAEALLEAGDHDRATRELSDTHAVARRLGAAPLRDAVEDLARRARIALPGARPRRDVVDPLTARERAVLELVAEGLTNRQVGERLFISEKTVSVHLSRAMGKLGANRRAEAVAIAYDRGLLTPDTVPTKPRRRKR
jgi:ATP/maltotriose-dependent transcriptional regulator MalT